MKNLKKYGLTVENDDIVLISNKLYVKSPEALKRLLKELKEIGYEIKDCSKDTDREGLSRQEQEQEGLSLWFASLRNIRRGKCGSCGRYVDVKGIRAHGRICEYCGAVLYREVIDGSTVRFLFKDDNYSIGSAIPVMKVRRLEDGWLYLYRQEEARLESFCETVEDPEQFEQYLSEHSDEWEAVEEDGISLIRVRYILGHLDESDINMHDIQGHEFNSKIVNLWKGEEYSKHGVFPIPESYVIYETWHWNKKPAGSKLHAEVMGAAGLVSHQDYYSQNGRNAFTGGQMQRVATYLQHFTELDHEEFLKLLPRMRKDGPGFIEDFASFCSGEEIPEIENNPNM